jgi:CRP-like cAMP-binding protein
VRETACVVRAPDACEERTAVTTVDVDQYELQEALRNTEIFEILPASALARVADAGEILALARGDLLFESGQPADCIYLLLDGAIEIVRPTDESTRPVPVAYITPGELIGEMALMTGTPRRSDARVPESARIWRLDRDRFEELTTELGSYGFELARMYARRLQEIITHMRRQARRKELSGKLQYFDMPTVVQTLLTTGQAGILTFTRETGEVFAEVVLGKGFVDRARCGKLDGEDAFHEIFLRCDAGEFSFRSVIGAVSDAVSQVPINAPAMHLLMEAVRRSDEIDTLRQLLQVDQREFRAVTSGLVWDGSADREVAEQIHAALQSPARLDDLRADIACSTYRFFTTVAALVETGQIG